MGKRQPKGLIIQNNPFSYTTGNGKTITSMFSEWESANLAQIFTSNMQPDFSICESYFKMSDATALTSFFSKKPYGTEILANTQIQNEESNLSTVRHNGLRVKIHNWMSESAFVASVRDFVWRKSKWNNPKLVKWLDAVNPQFVFLSAGNMSVFYDMALYISDKYHIPLFAHIGDDYFIYRRSLNLWTNLHRRKMSRKLSEVIAKSQCVIAICDKMARIFHEKYGGNYLTCMNSVEIATEPEIKERNTNSGIRLVYAGNLGINRWKILNLIGRALLELQQEGIYAELDVYSSFEPDTRILKKLTIPGVMKFCGSVFGSELKEVKNCADILVHVEAFEKRYCQLTYTAMSTKIPEYLSTGRIILAVGPQEAASVEFLQQNEVALVVTEYSMDAVKEQIRRYAGSEGKEFVEMRKRAVQIARDKFSNTINAKRIYETITKKC